MIIYQGYYYFKRTLDSSISKCCMNKGTHGVLTGCYYPESWKILVNKDDVLEEQIKSVLHELAHLGLEYYNIVYEDLESKYKGIKDEFQGNSEIEEIIDKEVEKFYTE